jgi:hypothetical protein
MQLSGERRCSTRQQGPCFQALKAGGAIYTRPCTVPAHRCTRHSHRLCIIIPMQQRGRQHQSPSVRQRRPPQDTAKLQGWPKPLSGCRKCRNDRQQQSDNVASSSRQQGVHIVRGCGLNPDAEISESAACARSPPAAEVCSVVGDGCDGMVCLTKNRPCRRERLV